MLEKEMDIIKQVETGQITAEEAADLLNDINQPEVGPMLTRKQILEQIAENQISPEEGMALLQQVSDPQLIDDDKNAKKISFSEDEMFAEEMDEKSYPEFDAIKARWRNWWMVPAVIGAIFTGLGGLWMYKGWSAQGLGWQFWLAWIPLIFGVVLLLLSADNRDCPWLFIRIQERTGMSPTISLNFPLPISFVTWFWNFLSLFKPKTVSGEDWQSFRALLDEFNQNGEPMHIQVDDGDGDKVEVWIG